MKFKYLGTAAAERVPAVFCDCENCKMARELGGKNIRTCSQAMIDEDLLIDLCPDTYMHEILYGLNLNKIKYLLVTHSHGDHFAPYELIMRQKPYAHGLNEELLVLCNAAVADEIYKTGITNVNGSVKVTVVEPFKTYIAGDYAITPLPARHMTTEQALIYVIEKEGKKILYGHDSGYFYDEVFDYLKTNKIKFDFISLDCTEGFIILGETAIHMSLNLNKQLCEKLCDIGSVTAETKIFLNHFSHNGKPIQEKLEEQAIGFGAKVAFDGEEIEL